MKIFFARARRILGVNSENFLLPEEKENRPGNLRFFFLDSKTLHPYCLCSWELLKVEDNIGETSNDHMSEKA